MLWQISSITTPHMREYSSFTFFVVLFSYRFGFLFSVCLCCMHSIKFILRIKNRAIVSCSVTCANYTTRTCSCFSSFAIPSLFFVFLIHWHLRSIIMVDCDGQKWQEYLANLHDGLQAQTTHTSFLEKTLRTVEFTRVPVIYANTTNTQLYELARWSLTLTSTPWRVMLSNIHFVRFLEKTNYQQT
jgi:hypothetical protein